MKAAIIGGGIGGMAAAIALRLRGIEVDLYEQAAKFEEVGAGVQISSNGYHVLAALGVGEAVRATSYEPENIQMRHGSNGRMIVNIPIQQVAQMRWRAPYLHMRRSTLHDALVARANALGAVLFMNRKIQPDEIRNLDADFIIAADGINSQCRTHIFNTSAARFSGKTAWRSVVPASHLDILPPGGATAWAEKNIHAVTTWIDGGKSINFVGISEGDWQDADWNGGADRKKVEALFFHFVPQVCEVIAKSDKIMKWALFEHEPLQAFSQDNIALIGDAAHPMMPSLAQGAVMALEDAWVLAKCLSDHQVDGLAIYSTLRIKRVARVQKESERNLNRFHRNGIQKWVEYSGAKALSRFMPSYFIKRLDWLYGVDVTIDEKI